MKKKHYLVLGAVVVLWLSCWASCGTFKDDYPQPKVDLQPQVDSVLAYDHTQDDSINKYYGVNDNE